MKRRRVCKLLCSILVSVLLLTGIPIFQAEAATGAAQLYVATDGDDTAAGTSIETPLKTLEAARDKIREMKSNGTYPEEGVIVNILGGEYSRLEDSFTLDALDSGTEEGPIIYRAYNNEEVVFTGGISVDESKFVPVTEPDILARLDDDVEKNVLVYDIGVEDGITSFVSNPNKVNVTLDGEIQTLSRYPNDSMLTIAKTESTGLIISEHRAIDGLCQLCTAEKGYDVPKHSDEWYSKQDGGIFLVADSILMDKYDILTRETDVWAFGYWTYDWADYKHTVTNIEKTDSRLRITLGEPSGYGVGAYGTYGRRFYLFNLLCEVDSPGEWFLDRENAKLYYYPKKDLADSNVSLVMGQNTLVVMNNVKYVEFQNISFVNGNGNGMEVVNSEYVEIAGCKFENLAKAAIQLNGYNNTIRSCDIANMGEGGVYVSGGDVYTLTPSNNLVINCDFSNFSMTKRTYSPAIMLNDCGGSAIRNRIYDAPHEAIQFTTVNGSIEGNEIYDVCYETSDAGAIYCGRSWYADRGTVIKNNYIHDMVSNSGEGSSAVYIDDCAAGVIVTQNLFVNIPGRGALFGGGRDNEFTNNIQINQGNGIMVTYASRKWPSLVAGPNGKLVKPFKEFMEDSRFDEEAWKEQFPEIFEIDLENYEYQPNNGAGLEYFYTNAAIPANGVVTNNIAVGVANPYGIVGDEMKQNGTYDNNVIYDVGTPIGFTDVDNGVYTVGAGSTIKAIMGDAHFNPNECGLYIDEYRTSLPGELEAELETSKTVYQADEKVEVSLTVSNLGSETIKNVRTEIHVPEGLKLLSGSLTQENFDLEAGEIKISDTILLSLEEEETPESTATPSPTATAEPTASPSPTPTVEPTASPEATATPSQTEEPTEPTEPPTPSEEQTTTPSGNQNEATSEGQNASAKAQETSVAMTGDTAKPFVWTSLILVLGAAIVLLVYRYKKAGKGLLFLVLALVVSACIMPGMTVKAATETKSITVSTKVNVDGKDFTITADIYYEETIADPAPIDKEALQTLVNEANALLKDAEVGNEPGKWSQEAVEALQTAVDVAQAVLDNADAGQHAVNAEVSLLKEAIEQFKNSQIIAPYSFFEGFREIDPSVWTQATVGGSITTENAHSGRYSFKMDSDQLTLKYEFDEALSNKEISFWLYDPLLGNDNHLSVMGRLSGASGSLCSMDLVAGSVYGWSDWAVINGSIARQQHASEVSRTKDWHKFRYVLSEIDEATGKVDCDMYIDETKVATVEDIDPPIAFDLRDVWAGNTSNVFIDDFTVGTPLVKENVLSIYVPDEDKNISLNAEGTYQINAVAEADPDVDVELEYITKNSNVVTVSAEGLLTAVGNGKTTVTIQNKNGEEKKTATINVTVGDGTSSNYSTVTVADLIADEENWESKGGTGAEPVFESGQIKLGALGTTCRNSYKEQYTNTLLNFKYKVNYLKEGGSSWGGIYLVANTNNQPWVPAGVLICFKQDRIEVQRRGAEEPIFLLDTFKELEDGKEYDITKLEDGKEYDITFGMYDESDTEIRIILRIDGEDVFNDTVTDSTLLSSKNYFGVFASDARVTLGESTTPPVMSVDKEALQVLVNEAKALLNDAEVGNEPGQWSQDAMNALQTAVDAAQAVLNNSAADQQAVNNEVSALEEAIEQFENSQNIDTYSFFEGFREIDPSVWTQATVGGSITTENAHSGRYSFKMDSDQLTLKYEFDEALSNKEISFWLYDPLLENNNYLSVMARLSGASGSLCSMDLAASAGVDVYSWSDWAVIDGKIARQQHATEVSRTRDWHKFRYVLSEIDEATGKVDCDMYIDETKIATVKDIDPPISFDLRDTWAGNTSNIFIDDFTVGTPLVKENVLSIYVPDDDKNIKLNVGGTHQINAVAEADPDVDVELEYITENANIVTVSAEGLITAVGNGETTVTIQNKNGEEKKTATINVTVGD